MSSEASAPFDHLATAELEAKWCVPVIAFELEDPGQRMTGDDCPARSQTKVWENGARSSLGMGRLTCIKLFAIARQRSTIMDVYLVSTPRLPLALDRERHVDLEFSGGDEPDREKSDKDASHFEGSGVNWSLKFGV